MATETTTKRVHQCPNGHVLTAKAVADSDGRIWSSWMECQKCGWRSGDYMTADHLRSVKA